MGVGKPHQKGERWSEEGILLDIIDYAENGGDLRSSVFCIERRNTSSAMSYNKIGYRDALERARLYLLGKGHEDLARKFDNYDQHLRRPGAFQVNENVTKEKLTEWILARDKDGLDLHVTAVKDDNRYKEAVRKFGTWKAAYEQVTGKSYDDIRHGTDWSCERISEQLIEIARNGGDIRYYRLSQDHHDLARAIGKKRYFPTHKDAIDATRELLLARGETELAEKFDYAALAKLDKRHSRKKTIPAEKPRELHRKQTYSLEQLTDLGIIGQEHPLSGSDIESLLQTNGWLALECAAAKLSCSPDTLRVHATKRHPSAFTIIYHGSTPHYLVNESCLDTLVERTARTTENRIKEGLAEIAPSQAYTINELRTLLGISRNTIIHLFGHSKGSYKHKGKRMILGSAVTAHYRSVPGIVGYSIREAAQLTGVKTSRVRALVRKKRVSSTIIGGETRLNDKNHLQLQLVIEQEEDKKKQLTERISQEQTYRFCELIIKGFPLHALYKRRRSGAFTHIAAPDGTYLFLGSELIDYLGTYTTTRLWARSRAIVHDAALLLNSQEAAKRVGIPNLRLIRQLNDIDFDGPIKIHEQGTAYFYLVPTHTLERSVCETPPPKPAAQYIGPHGGPDIITIKKDIPERRKNLEDRVLLSWPVIKALASPMANTNRTAIETHRRIAKEEFLSIHHELKTLETQEQQLIQKIIDDNKGLIYACAKTMGVYKMDEDLLQPAMLGIWNALKTYDGSTRFSTWAFTPIKWQLASELQKRPAVHLPQSRLAQLKQIKQALEEIAQTSGTPTTEALCDQTGLPKDLVEDILRTRRVSSLDVSTDEDGNLYGFIPSPEQNHSPAPSESPELQAALDTLTFREHQVVCSLFGLNGEEELSRTKIAKKLKMSGQRVNVIAARALEKIRSCIS